jgi:hypothetical protein
VFVTRHGIDINQAQFSLQTLRVAFLLAGEFTV